MLLGILNPHYNIELLCINNHYFVEHLKVEGRLNGEIPLYGENLSELPVVCWPHHWVACSDLRFAVAGTDIPMELISTAAFQRVTGERNIATVHYPTRKYLSSAAGNEPVYR